MASILKRVTATGAVVTGRAKLKSVVLFGGSAASSVTIDDSTDGSATDLLSLNAPANDSRIWSACDPDGVLFGTGIHATLAGTGAVLTVEYE